MSEHAYSWQCDACGEPLSSSSAPNRPENSKCLGCRTDAQLAIAQRMIRELAQENNQLRADVRKLEKEAGDALDMLYAEQEKGKRLVETLDNVLRREAELRAEKGVVT